MTNETSQSRTPAGVPTGGQFAASAKSESNVGLGDPAIPLADAVTADDGLYIPEHEMPGVYPFTDIDVTRNDDGSFAVAATAHTDMTEGLTLALCRQRGLDPLSDEAEPVEEEALAWLNEHKDDVDAWFTDTTGSAYVNESEWNYIQFGWHTTLPSDASTDQVVDAAVAVSGEHPDSTDGFYDRMLREAPDHVKCPACGEKGYRDPADCSFCADQRDADQ